MSGGHSGGGLPFLDTIENLFHEAHEKGGITPDAKPFIYAGIGAVIAFLFLSPLQTWYNFQMVVFLSPIWMPVLFTRFAIHRFVEANRVAWLASQQYVLLELRVPRDIQKSPLAMETILTNLNITQGESSWYKKYINGSVRPTWSFEIVSLGGRVHFYVRTRVGYRRSVESFFYAQYPGIEVIEAMDYALLTDPSHAPNKMWGCDYKKKKQDAIPIRTYAEFLKPDAPLPKPEETIDPLAQVIELLGSIGPKEQFWVQINCRITGSEKYGNRKNAQGKPYTWKDEAEEIVRSIREQSVRKIKRFDPATQSTIDDEMYGPVTKGQQESSFAIERNVNKPGFDVSMRAIYTAPEDSFDGSMITFLINLWKPMSAEGGNGLGIQLWDAIFSDYPWEDKGGRHKAHLEHQLVDAYRRRSGFNEPYKLNWMIMSSEEVATLFHIPSASVMAPALPRIQSSTSEAPANLPI
ncbi:MAG TPA: hypothetical protein VFY28_01470 [Candidatus Paceibacterota bacterium]|nr:hypothetical protein [Candidatus Paceibacterota bacterium]